MRQEQLMSIVLGPHISEKSTRAQEDRQVVFKVHPRANKQSIAKAIELLFDVKVDGVQVVNVNGKAKRFGAHQGRRKNWKKAYVKLAEGHDIDFLGAD